MIDKVKVARSFTRSAATYDEAAGFQRRMGTKLLSELRNQDIKAKTCLDLGCGTGYFREPLHEYSGLREYVGLDIAEGMLNYFRQKSSRTKLICGDAEQLPLASDSLELIYSNFTLQWCENLSQLFFELNRALVPGGVLAFTTLGTQTLHELRQAWRSVDNLVHVNEFTPQRAWQEAIAECDFDTLYHFRSLEILHYSTVEKLLRELKYLGAHNINEGQRQSLTGRYRLQKLLRSYEQFREENHYPASYEVLFWILRKTIS